MSFIKSSLKSRKGIEQVLLAKIILFVLVVILVFVFMVRLKSLL